MSQEDDLVEIEIDPPLSSERVERLLNVFQQRFVVEGNAVLSFSSNIVFKFQDTDSDGNFERLTFDPALMRQLDLFGIIEANMPNELSAFKASLEAPLLKAMDLEKLRLKLYLMEIGSEVIDVENNLLVSEEKVSPIEQEFIEKFINIFDANSIIQGRGLEKDEGALARNEWICWIESAKKKETRDKRIKWGRENLSDGKRRPCCWAGCSHR